MSKRSVPRHPRSQVSHGTDRNSDTFGDGTALMMSEGTPYAAVGARAGGPGGTVYIYSKDPVAVNSTWKEIKKLVGGISTQFGFVEGLFV